ncbi:MAG: phenylalanine--tRNA ligase subunit beta, partial [Clostridia bacterium]|nr:phenylalanine--tRNA ligase subunit beta [Clostridia bacterium]
IYGYEHIVGTPMTGAVQRGNLTPERRHTDRMKATLVAQGVREITTYSFINRKAADTLRLAADDERRNAVALLNPLSEEFGVMRTQLISSMLTVLATNYNRKNAAARFFEVSRLFKATTTPLTEQPEERPALSLGFYGEGEDFYTMKGVVETLCRGLRISFVASNEPFLHPGRQAAVMLNNQPVGVFGEVHPDVADDYGFGVRVYVAQFELAPLFAAAKPLVRYQPLPRFPAVERDLALLCHEDLPVGEIADTIRRAGGRYLESVTLFDVYKGAQIEAGKKSVAFSLTFRSAEGTLSDEQISPALDKIFKNLREKDCILRS